MHGRGRWGLTAYRAVDLESPLARVWNCQLSRYLSSAEVYSELLFLSPIMPPSIIPPNYATFLVKMWGSHKLACRYREIHLVPRGR